MLGAGGVQGGAWLTGGLDALARETGWDPATADFVVGTSAGSMIGSLCVAGIPPWFMVAHSAGETLRRGRRRPGPARRRRRPLRRARVFRLAARAGRRSAPAPGAWRCAPCATRAATPPAPRFAGWAPRGFISTEPLRDIIRARRPERLDRRTPRHWVVACDYATGRRVAFGRDDAPEADLADAVAASCAIPGFYHPVEIAGRRYVDGGIYSTSNLDLLRDERLDLVICLNPTSSLHPTRAWNPARAARPACSATPPGAGSAARRRSCAPQRHRGRPDPADRRRPRGDGPEPDEPQQPQPGDRDRAAHGRRAARQLAINRELLDGLPAGDERRVRRPEAGRAAGRT